MRRTGHDFPEVHVFREFPSGAREHHDRGSYPLRAVGANRQPQPRHAVLNRAVARTGFLRYKETC